MKEDYIEQINNNELNMYMNKSKSKIWIDSLEEEVLIDFSWIEKIEECLPYLDKVIRNPKRFLIQEEEIINVEKSKKVTTETIMHLAQNTNLIEDIDSEGMVQPKKVLNITKEETIDIYENRFIYTLLKNLNNFVDRQIEKFGEEGSYYKCNRKVNFEGVSKLKYDVIRYTISLENSRKHEVPILKENELSIEDRLISIKALLSGFNSTDFIKSLTSVALVKSPIRKTNLILKEPNFKKAAELWDYLESFEIEEPKITNKTEILEDNKDIKELYNFASYIAYDALSLLDTKHEKKKSNLYNSIFIKNLIEDYLDEVGGSERIFTRMLKEQFKIVQKFRRKREKDIKRICGRFIQRENANLEKGELILK